MYHDQLKYGLLGSRLGLQRGNTGGGQDKKRPKKEKGRWRNEGRGTNHKAIHSQRGVGWRHGDPHPELSGVPGSPSTLSYTPSLTTCKPPTRKLVTVPPLARDFPGGSGSKVSAYNVGYLGSIPGSGRSPGEGNGNPLQYSCLENPMHGGAW